MHFQYAGSDISCRGRRCSIDLDQHAQQVRQMRNCDHSRLAIHNDDECFVSIDRSITDAS